MVDRRPLVIGAAGAPTEMPAGDTLPSAIMPPGGGSADLDSIAVDVTNGTVVVDITNGTVVHG